jgi:O-antigen ligase
MSSLNARPYLNASGYRGTFETESQLVRALGGLLVAALCLLLAFGPLAFGAVQEWAICTLEVGAAVCVALWAVRQLACGRLAVRRNTLFVPIVLFAALVGVQLLSGRTAYWYVTWRSALLWASYGMIFFVATQCLRRSVWIRTFALFFTSFGFLVALFAIIQQLTWNGNLYWVVPNRNGGMVYGPYVNHAHYAGLIEMLVPIPLVFAMMESWPRSLRVFFAFVALLMASTIFLSRSLGGMVAFGAQMVILAVIVGLRERSRRQVLLLLLLGVLLTVWLVTLSPGGIRERIEGLHDPLGKAGAGDRLAIVKDSLKIVGERPILGWGLGTFPVVYPSFRSFYTNFFVNEAHNDYVQSLVETGLAGFAIVCGFIGLFYRASLTRIERWRTEIRSAMSLAAIIGVTGILVHSFSDFNLQIPANAALFFALAALATGSSNDHVAKHWVKL